MTVCQICSAPFFKEKFEVRSCLKDPLCRSCAMVLQTKPLVQTHLDFCICYSLFNWRVGDFTGKNLLHDFKGEGLSTRYGFFSNELVRKWLSLTRLDLRQGVVVVPAPAKLAFAEDHAVLMAYELAKNLGAPVFNGLRRAHAGFQKARTLKDRRQIRLLMGRALPRALRERSLLFVDDVVTTGSTARAAYEVLQPQHGFEVLTLAARPSLQNEAKVAITSDA